MEYEDLLRLVQKNLTIPFWDWTVSPASPYTAPIFHSTYGFGNSSDAKTGCVDRGPFRLGEFNISSPNGSVGCLTRDYKNATFLGREILEKSLSLSFAEFHNFVQLVLSLNTRCFVGGELCSTNAASDPLFLLHLARVDLFVQKWQEERGEIDKSPLQGSNERDNLQHTLAKSLLVSDFSSNDQLPFGTCVKYAPLGAVSKDEPDDQGGVPCAPLDRLRKATVLLSEQAEQYLARTCDDNT